MYDDFVDIEHVCIFRISEAVIPHHDLKLCWKDAAALILDMRRGTIGKLVDAMCCSEDPVLGDRCPTTSVR